MAQFRTPRPALPDAAGEAVLALRRQSPERLAGCGFRHIMPFAATGDLSGWALAEQTYANVVGHERAEAIVTDLGGFARCVCRAAQRRIETLPAGCPGFCRDECLAISIIAASQHGACPALKACAFALLASSEVCATLDAATSLADRLRDAGQVLSLDSVCNAAALVPERPGWAS